MENLFDDYASSFETHLVNALRYRAPELLREAVGRVSGVTEAHWSVIDLGCGTGLCGPLFRGLAQRLVGVDLSAGMLEKAKERKVYDELETGELTTTLEANPASFDLVIAADVFIYVGDLKRVFNATLSALHPNGLFAFTVGRGVGPRFTLTTSGRYSHSPEYIESLAHDRGFDIALRELITPRLEQGQPVAGELFVLRGPP